MSKEQKGEYAYWCYGVKGKWTNIREENPNVNVKICVILLHSDDRRLCEVLALSYAQKLENKEAIMRREADTKESRLAQKRQEKAEKKVAEKKRWITERKREKVVSSVIFLPCSTYDRETTVVYNLCDLPFSFSYIYCSFFYLDGFPKYLFKFKGFFCSRAWVVVY